MNKSKLINIGQELETTETSESLISGGTAKSNNYFSDESIETRIIRSNVKQIANLNRAVKEQTETIKTQENSINSYEYKLSSLDSKVSEIKKQYSSIEENRKNIEEENKIIKEENKNIKSDFITILGIFVSVFTFISIEITILKSIVNPFIMIGLSLFILGGLLGFLVVLHLIINKYQNSQEFKTRRNDPMIIVIGSIILLGIIFSTIGACNKKTPEIVQELEKRIDILEGLNKLEQSNVVQDFYL